MVHATGRTASLLHSPASLLMGLVIAIGAVDTRELAPQSAPRSGRRVTIKATILGPDRKPALKVNPTLELQVVPRDPDAVEAEFKLTKPLVLDKSGVMTYDANSLEYASVTLVIDDPAFATYRRNLPLREEVVDFGSISLTRGGEVSGTFRMAKCPESNYRGWKVYAQYGGDPAASADAFSGLADPIGEYDPATKAFRFRRLLPHSIQILAWSRVTGRVVGPRVEVQAGKVVTADIDYDGPDPRTIVKVGIRTRPFVGFESGKLAPPVEVRLLDSKGNATAPTARDDHESTFTGLTPGKYKVEIRDPRFKPLERDVETGEAVEVKLQGSASLRVRCVDPAAAKRLTNYHIEVVLLDKPLPAEPIPIAHLRSEGADADAFEGIVPGNLLLRVTAKGYTPAEARVDALQPSESRSVEIRLQPADGK